MKHFRMFWKYGLFCSIFAGSIWGAFWQIIFTMMGILTFGIPLELDVNQMLIIGLVSGIFYINFQKIISMKIHLTAIFTMTLLVYVFSFGKPYQINESLNNINIFINKNFNNIKIVIFITYIWFNIRTFFCNS